MCSRATQASHGRMPRAGPWTPAAGRVRRILAAPQLADQVRVASRILALEVVEETTTLADQFQQAATRVMILRVHLEVLRQVIDPLAQERDLNFRRPGVAVVSCIGPDDPGLG